MAGAGRDGSVGHGDDSAAASLDGDWEANRGEVRMKHMLTA